MSSFIRSIALLALAASVQAAPASRVVRATEDHLKRDLRTLNKFAKTITSDPNGIIAGNWTGNDPCKFSGIVCENNLVIGIDFNGFQLGDDLDPSFISKLTDLTFLHANSNNFTRTITDLHKLPLLTEIDVSNNLLSGPFPKQFLDAPLTFLDIRFNEFTGEVPAEVFNKPNLDLIFLNNNQFSGPLPEFGTPSPSTTAYVTFANNKFTGPIPDSISNMVVLEEILFSNNSFSGPVPESLCAIKSLTVLDISGNPDMDLNFGPNCQKLADKKVLTWKGLPISEDDDQSGDDQKTDDQTDADANADGSK